MNITFADKVALITGGTGGLGKAVALAFLNAGAKVAVTYRNQEGFSVLKIAAGANASSLTGFQTDITDATATQQLIGKVVAQHDRLDVLVNAVGGYVGGVNVLDLTPETFDQMLTLNLRSGFTLVRAALPQMLKQKHGAIVNVSAKAAFDHAAGTSAYSASKAAAVALMDSLAEELKGTGVRANSILPRIIDTATNRKDMPNATYSDWPSPEDVARVILLLCHEDAKVIHGAAIPVYGDR
ncbi:SDR family NAD(P)-dependent oxidoreductase [Granulicella sp. dw_53]|uniref:SDR family NAD(P)-dependent oxidoreductase n=1 Tax=Granulicella sp. dw_53 TaxID=2719792 RepID=UPI001BD54969|nr:SDR family NAD(P)-dependent oxidoreductase [Granulicella sp. dw_53]